MEKRKEKKLVRSRAPKTLWDRVIGCLESWYGWLKKHAARVGMLAILAILIALTVAPGITKKLAEKMLLHHLATLLSAMTEAIRG